MKKTTLTIFIILLILVIISFFLQFFSSSQEEAFILNFDTKNLTAQTLTAFSDNQLRKTLKETFPQAPILKEDSQILSLDLSFLTINNPIEGCQDDPETNTYCADMTDPVNITPEFVDYIMSECIDRPDQDFYCVNLFAQTNDVMDENFQPGELSSTFLYSYNLNSYFKLNSSSADQNNFTLYYEYNSQNAAIDYPDNYFPLILKLDRTGNLQELTYDNLLPPVEVSEQNPNLISLDQTINNLNQKISEPLWINPTSPNKDRLYVIQEVALVYNWENEVYKPYYLMSGSIQNARHINFGYFEFKVAAN
ncbi:MAG: hypothetical protein Q4G02_02420 [bacterium]|nr:hypothetical protein [bacterium]